MTSALVERLLDPAAYGTPPDRVTHVETHISDLFFAGERVYKVKKPVDLGFLDYTTLAARQRFCAEEVRLNRRLAADIYLGVVPIRELAGGALAVGPGPGAVCEYAVEMVRLPQSRMMDELLDRGDIDNQRMRDLATRLAGFHRDAATGPGVDEFGAFAMVQRNCEENFEQTEPFLERAISSSLHGHLRERCAAFLETHHDLFAQRVAAARIRDGHGDLHAGNICVLPDEIVIYDCIEFAPKFRCGDVIADLSFLLMDLDRRCFRSFGEYLLREYVVASGDEAGRELVDFYKGYRAMVRGKVACFAAEWERAVDYFHLAASYELPNALFLCCGLPGSGKSFLAERLARPFAAIVCNSDRTRKRLVGLAETASASAPVGEGIYDAAHDERTYAALLADARRHLEHGRSVVVDAGFRQRARREPFRELAAELGVQTVIVHVETAPALALERIARRSTQRTASDADADVYAGLRRGFEAPTAEEGAVVHHDGVAVPRQATAQVIDALVRTAGGS